MAHSVEETVWITMPDGVRLAATLWMPSGAGPFPAVLEFLPYRRRDGTAPRDESTYPTFAEAGIVGVRVDSRGMGDSEGLFDDEYSPQELQDCVDVIAWLAEQPWSNGAVGMMGISWGGFNGLQVAALRPPALKAVISIASTADRFNEDIHYRGGCLLSAHVAWAATMLAYGSRPPDPEIVPDWATVWKARLEATPMLLETWLSHQRRDDYWKHGSICEDWSAIPCPVWVIAGQADGYRNTPAQIARHLDAPVKATTGPWIHKYPHFAYPEPRIDFLRMAVDWWREWLCDEVRGVEDWPDHALYRIEGATPSDWRGDDPGQWVGVDPWAHGPVWTLALSKDGVLGGETGPPVEIDSKQDCGHMSGEFFTQKPDREMPWEQGPDDERSVCWQTGVLETPLDIVGRAVVAASVTVAGPSAMLAARLVDVAPDGRGTLIARGFLNLSHRHGNAAPRPMTAGVAEEIELALDVAAYRVRAGHRLRLALSNAYWPIVVPLPDAGPVTIAEAELVVPRAELSDVDLPKPDSADPLGGYPVLSERSTTRTVDRTPDGETAWHLSEDTGWSRHPRHAMESRETRVETWTIHPDDPTSARATLEWTTARRRGDWLAETQASMTFQARAETFEITATLHATATGADSFSKSWSFSVPRDHI